MKSVSPLLPGRAEAAGAAKREASDGGRMAEKGFGDMLDAGRRPASPHSRAPSAAARSEEAKPGAGPWGPRALPLTTEARASDAAAPDDAGRGAQGRRAEEARSGASVEAAAAMIPAPFQAGQAGNAAPEPDGAAAGEPIRRMTARPDAEDARPRRPALDGRTRQPEGRAAAATRADGSAAAHASRPSPARGDRPALPPELASLIAGGDVKAILPEREEPFSPDAAEARKGSPLLRLNAAVASLGLGGADARDEPARDRQARGAAGPATAAGERENAPRVGLASAGETPESAGEGHDAFGARSPAATPSFSASPPGLALAAAATPAAVAETLAANLPTPARPAASLPAGRPRPGDGVRLLTLELKPDALGAVTARLKLEETKLAVEITVATAEARDRLGPDGGEIARALEALGLSVDRVTVSLDDAGPGRENGAGRAPAGEDRFAAPGGQAGRDEGGKGGGPSRGSERIEAGRAPPPGSVYI